MEWIDIGGYALRYELQGSGKTLVLIHELGGLLESFDYVMPALAERFTVLRYDQRGAGHSEKIRGALTLDDYVGELEALIDGLALKGPLVLAGLALGGSVAIRYAVRNPAKVSKLMVTAPAVWLPDAARESIRERATAVEAGGVREHVERTLLRSYPPEIRNDGRRFERVRAQRISADPGSLAASMRVLASIDIREDLAQLKCPVLLLSGTHDLDRPPTEVQKSADLIAGAELARVESGHFIPQHNPEDFLKHLVPFASS